MIDASMYMLNMINILVEYTSYLQIQIQNSVSIFYISPFLMESILSSLYTVIHLFSFNIFPPYTIFFQSSMSSSQRLYQEKIFLRLIILAAKRVLCCMTKVRF